MLLGKPLARSGGKYRFSYHPTRTDRNILQIRGVKANVIFSENCEASSIPAGRQALAGGPNLRRRRVRCGDCTHRRQGYVRLLADLPAFKPLLELWWVSLPSLALYLVTAHVGFQLLRSGWKYGETLCRRCGLEGEGH